MNKIVTLTLLLFFISISSLDSRNYFDTSLEDYTLCLTEHQTAATDEFAITSNVAPEPHAAHVVVKKVTVKDIELPKRKVSDLPKRRVVAAAPRAEMSKKAAERKVALFTKPKATVDYVGYQPMIVATSYQSLLKDINYHRQHLAEQYQRVASSADKAKILADAESLFTKSLMGYVMPHWYGTPWDFYGHTDKPGSGFIACGYLVSTTLKHIGVNVNRYTLAQQWPINIVQSVASRQQTQFFVTKERAIEAITNMGYGVYAMGLDRHVGFIKYDEYGMQFVHSNYTGSRSVVAEPVEYSPAFSQTTSYYVGKLSNNEQFLLKWLNDGKVHVQK